MNDKTPRNYQVNRALRALNAHGMVAVESLILPNGSWQPFLSLPLLLRSYPRWDERDCKELCRAIEYKFPQSARTKLSGEGGQQQLQPVIISSLVSPRPVSRLSHLVGAHTANKFVCFATVSAYDEARDAWFCHYAPPEHSLSGTGVTGWQDQDWRLAFYLTCLAAVVSIPTSTGAVNTQHTYYRTRRDDKGGVTLEMRDENHNSLFIGMSGYR